MAAELRFPVMGSAAHVAVVGPPRLAHAARALLEDLEARWSRFRPDSEISRCNAAAGEPVAVSAPTAQLVARAIEAWRLTGGLVDAGVLPAVVAAGYDRTFAEVAARRPEAVVPAPAWTPPPACTDIEISDGAVRLPPGLAFDPGGLGKGFAADLVTEALLAEGAEGALVNVGGDLRVRGVGPDDGGWTIALEHAHSGAPLARIGVADGGVATSTTLRRRWSGPSGAAHHLIDPRTGAPSTSDIDHAVAIAADGWLAEVMAKAVLLRGRPHQFDLLGGTGAEGLSVAVDGTIEATPGFAAHLGGVPLPDALPDPIIAQEAS